MTFLDGYYILPRSSSRSGGDLVDVRARVSGISMRGYLLLLVFSVAIPAAVFAAILLQRY